MPATSQRATCTFCWLPPLRERTTVSIDGARMRSATVWSRGDRPLALHVEEAEPGDDVEAREHDVVGDRVVRHAATRAGPGT